MRGRAPGVSLAEGIIAIYLLIAGILVVFVLLNQGLRQGTRLAQDCLAVTVAERQLAALRDWARSPRGTGFNFDALAGYPGLASWHPDEDQPQLWVRVQASRFPLASPGGPVALRSLPNSAWRVTVSVNQTPSAAGALTLASLIGDPPRRLGSVVFSSGPVPPLAQGGSSSPIVAQGLDDSGNPILDLMFQWQMTPGTGFATLTPAADRRTSILSHRVLKRFGGTTYAPGTVEVQARSFYGNQRPGARQTVQLL